MDLRFRRPDASAIMKRIGPICQKEGLHFQPNSIEQIIQSTQSDIRQVLNSLATYRLNATNISYDDSKILYVFEINLFFVFINFIVIINI